MLTVVNVNTCEDKIYLSIWSLIRPINLDKDWCYNNTGIKA